MWITMNIESKYVLIFIDKSMKFSFKTPMLDMYLS